MLGIYDNGTHVIGEVSVLIRYWKTHEIEHLEELEELIQELEEIEKEHRRAIISINYDNPMGYTYEVWDIDKEQINVYNGGM